MTFRWNEIEFEYFDEMKRELNLTFLEYSKRRKMCEKKLDSVVPQWKLSFVKIYINSISNNNSNNDDFGELLGKLNKSCKLSSNKVYVFESVIFS